MADVLQWITENWLAVVLVVYALLNTINGVLKLVPGDQGEQAGGWLHKVLGWVGDLVDRGSVVTRSDADGTLKVPGSKSKREDA